MRVKQAVEVVVLAFEFVRGEAFHLVGEDDPAVGLVDIVIGLYFGLVVAYMPEWSSDADIGLGWCELVNDGLCRHAGVEDIIGDEHFDARTAEFEHPRRAFEFDGRGARVDTGVGGAFDDVVLYVVRAVAQVFMHGHPDGRPAPPNGKNQIRQPAAAVHVVG